MRKIVYAGGTFYTGNDVAEALLEYAGALARSSTAATVVIPGRTPDGAVGEVEVLIGPASQLISEPVPDEDLLEIVDVDVTERLRGLTAGLDREGSGQRG